MTKNTQIDIWKVTVIPDKGYGAGDSWYFSAPPTRAEFLATIRLHLWSRFWEGKFIGAIERSPWPVIDIDRRYNTSEFFNETGERYGIIEIGRETLYGVAGYDRAAVVIPGEWRYRAINRIKLPNFAAVHREEDRIQSEMIDDPPKILDEKTIIKRLRAAAKSH